MRDKVEKKLQRAISSTWTAQEPKADSNQTLVPNRGGKLDAAVPQQIDRLTAQTITEHSGFRHPTSKRPVLLLLQVVKLRCQVTRVHRPT